MATPTAKKSNYFTHQELEAFGDKLHRRIVDDIVEDISGVIQNFAKHVDQRFNAVDKRFNAVESEIGILKTDIGGIKKDIAALNEKYDRLLTTLDAFLKRLDDIETDNAARDAQLARLERRIERIEKQTGIKIEH